MMGYDCVNIPGAETTGNTRKMVGSNLCGRFNGLVTTDAASIAATTIDTGLNSKTICSVRTPFYIRFRSDQFEFTAAEAIAPDVGFELTYTMDSINCN